MDRRRLALGEEGIAEHPAPPSIARRSGSGWWHGRPRGGVGPLQSLAEVAEAVRKHPRVAVLVPRRVPPETVGTAFVAAALPRPAGGRVPGWPSPVRK